MTRFFVFILILVIFPFSNAFAQNTGGVFGPVVDEGHAAAEYRITYEPNEDVRAQRVHYQQSLNDDVMLRGVAQIRDFDAQNNEFDYVQGELFWQITPNENRWQTGLRFDGRIRGNDRPGFIGVHWTNQYQITPQLIGRLVGLSFFDVGENAQDGANLETRATLIYNLEHPVFQNAGVEIYNNYGYTSDFNDFDDQRHQVGPFTTIRAFEGLNVFAGGLFGLTDASNDQELRLWVTKFF